MIVLSVQNHLSTVYDLIGAFEGYLSHLPAFLTHIRKPPAGLLLIDFGMQRLLTGDEYLLVLFTLAGLCKAQTQVQPANGPVAKLQEQLFGIVPEVMPQRISVTLVGGGGDDVLINHGIGAGVFQSSHKIMR